jgi:hypothetical protein
MLFWETVAVYSENHTEHTDTARASQETHYVSATEPSRLMLFGETVAVYCENHPEHTDTVRNSQETNSVLVIKPNRLMLFGETVAVYCENHRKHSDTDRTSQETHYICATEPNRLMLFIVRTVRNTHIHCEGRMRSFIMLQQVVHIITTVLSRTYHTLLRVPKCQQMLNNWGCEI